MPEDLPILMAGALAAAFAVAGLVLLSCGWPWRAPHATRVAVGAVLGPGVGFYAGCVVLQSFLHWSVKEDQGRFLLVLLPAAIAVELVASLVRGPWLIAWLLRAGVVIAAARVLLHGSVYLADPSDLASVGWTRPQQAELLAGLTGGLGVVWVLLSLLMRRAPGRSVPLALAVTAAGAGLLVILSGSLTGGMPGLVLAMALAGGTAAALALPATVNLRGIIGPAVVALFAVLVSGHFFGDLPAGKAVLVFGAPLLCWLPELPIVRRAVPWLRAVVRVALVAVPVALVVVQAGQKFAADSRPAATGDGEPSADDYANYGK